MAVDALPFHPQGYMDFVLNPGDKTALGGKIIYATVCVILGDRGHC